MCVVGVNVNVKPVAGGETPASMAVWIQLANQKIGFKSASGILATQQDLSSQSVSSVHIASQRARYWPLIREQDN